ncbi:rhamnogalacturonan acetylesterase [Roseibacillus persicicus]|uniref:rhamnogalacturonan acetylesterase n=1 Tax=Roseibacillus persicicus TaxID=454148 RepID=UPI00280FF410|nr:rhamnogalacturonan acetylesterase [Roseibacillus persicicus]MDQ8188918.1 rhamnogalacturonan acetylesterase [Roseibacillus persicicus]
MYIRLLLFLALTFSLSGQPTLWIIGDSTVRNNTRGQQGWGDPLAEQFDSDQITVTNRALGGRSSRTFLTEGRWEEVLTKLKKGDFVLIQFGHNDGGKMFSGNRPRASIKGNGDESTSGVVEETGKEETVHSYGWYLRKYCQKSINRGATPIVCSPIPRNIRGADGKFHPDETAYAKWAKEAAQATGASFIPLNALLCHAFNQMEKDEVDKIFCETDHTHTSSRGATFNARVVADAIRQLPNSSLARSLKSPANSGK